MRTSMGCVMAGGGGAWCKEGRGKEGWELSGGGETGCGATGGGCVKGRLKGWDGRETGARDGMGRAGLEPSSTLTGAEIGGYTGPTQGPDTGYNGKQMKAYLGRVRAQHPIPPRQGRPRDHHVPEALADRGQLPLQAGLEVLAGTAEISPHLFLLFLVLRI